MPQLGICSNRKNCVLAAQQVPIPFASGSPHCPDCGARLVLKEEETRARAPGWVTFAAFSGFALILLLAVGNFLYQAHKVEEKETQTKQAPLPSGTPHAARISMDSTAMGSGTGERVVAATPVLVPTAAPAPVAPAPSGSSEHIERAVPVAMPPGR